MTNEKYITCGHVYNVLVNDNKTNSECPLGAYGIVDGAQCLSEKEMCKHCNNYTERKAPIISVDEKHKNAYAEKILKRIIEEKNLQNKAQNRSYLYNDVMQSFDDKKLFDSCCREKISNECKNKNIKEGRPIKLTDIY